MADAAHSATDDILSAMEKHLTEIYTEAQTGVEKAAKSYFKKFEAADKRKQKQVDAGTLSEEEYRQWRINKMAYGKRFDDMRTQVSSQLLHVNETAVAYINGEMPEIYTLNYNAFPEITENMPKGYSFTLLDENTVRNLATKDESLLPFKKVNGKKDIAWNNKQVTSQLMQGILLGEDIPKISKRMMRVADINRSSAVRNARTMVTSAENKGRLDSYHTAEDDGLILEKEWMSSNQPKRTRDWHMPSAFKKLSVPIDKPFHNDMGDIMYPGDPEADPANVWNCRCTMVATVKGFRKGKQKEIMQEEQKVQPLTEDTKKTLRDYTSGKYGYYCEYSQALASKKGEALKAAISEIDKGEGSGWYIQDMGLEKAKERTEEIIKAIENQNSVDTPLYRIERFTPRHEIKEGTVFDWGIHSTSRDEGFIKKALSGEDEGFGEYNAEKFYAYEIIGKKKHLDISEYSEFEQQESLVYGKFKVVSIEEPIFKSKYKKQTFLEAKEENPENFEFFTSKKGNEMVRFKNGSTLRIDQAEKRDFYNGEVDDGSFAWKIQEEKEAFAREPIKIKIEQVIE